MFLLLSVLQVGVEEGEERGCCQECPGQLGEDVGKDGSPGEATPHGERNRDRRVDVRPADGTDRLDRQHDGDPPDDRNLPEPALSPGKDGSVDCPAPEEDQEVRSQALCQALLDQGGSVLMHDESLILGPVV